MDAAVGQAQVRHIERAIQRDVAGLRQLRREREKRRNRLKRSNEELAQLRERYSRMGIELVIEVTPHTQRSRNGRHSDESERSGG